MCVYVCDIGLFQDCKGLSDAEGIYNIYIYIFNEHSLTPVLTQEFVKYFHI